MKLSLRVTFGLLALVLLAPHLQAQKAAVNNNGLLFTILSARTLSGTAGDFVTVDAQVKNVSQSALANITTYLSLVDTESKIPVDLEDWSAEKGRFIGTIEAGQTLPLKWQIHFVKAGKYDLSIVGDIADQSTPAISTITHFSVLPKKNLNPGQVLPVALITPLVLVFVFFLLNYRKQRH